MATNDLTPTGRDGVFDVERIKALRLVAEHADGGWFSGDDHLGAVFTGAGTITANGLVSAVPDVAVTDLGQLTSRLGAGRSLQSVQVGAVASADQREWAEELGLRRAVPIPTMTMDLTQGFEVPAHSHETRIAGLRDSDAMIACITDGFELGTLAESAPFANRGVLAEPGVTGAVVTSSDGHVVSAGLSIQTSPDVVGIYAIATPPRERRRGHGAAVTRLLLHAAREQGVRVAYLQASPYGEPVYRRIGFTLGSPRTYLF